MNWIARVEQSATKWLRDWLNSTIRTLPFDFFSCLRMEWTIGKVTRGGAANNVWCIRAAYTSLLVMPSTGVWCAHLMCCCLCRVLHKSSQPSVPLFGCAGCACSSAMVVVEEILSQHRRDSCYIEYMCSLLSNFVIADITTHNFVISDNSL